MAAKTYRLNVVYTDNTQKNFENLKYKPCVEYGFLVITEDDKEHHINLANLYGYTVGQVK